METFSPRPIHRLLAGCLLGTALVACGDKPANPPPADTATPPPASSTAAPAESTASAGETTGPAATSVSTVGGEAAVPGTSTVTTTGANSSAPAAATTPASSGSASVSSATSAPATATPAPTAPAMATNTARTMPAAPAAASTSTPATSAGAESGTLLRAEPLREKPASDAREIAALAAGAKVTVAGREGAWYQVNADGKSGWVRMLSVRKSAAATGNNIAGIAGIASGRTGTGSVVTTTGVRGLDSEDLKTAAFNEERVAKSESYRIDRAAADAFAQSGGLKKQSVPDLPAAK